MCCHVFQWSLLADANIWKDAATQMFFTLSLGFGALIAFASYMPLHNQVMRDAYTVVFINCGTSLFAGIVVFSILGYREHVTGIPATEVCYSSDQSLQAFLLKGLYHLLFQITFLQAMYKSWKLMGSCIIHYLNIKYEQNEHYIVNNLYIKYN